MSTGGSAPSPPPSRVPDSCTRRSDPTGWAGSPNRHRLGPSAPLGARSGLPSHVFDQVTSLGSPTAGCARRAVAARTVLCRCSATSVVASSPWSRRVKKWPPNRPRGVHEDLLGDLHVGVEVIRLGSVVVRSPVEMGQPVDQVAAQRAECPPQRDRHPRGDRRDQGLHRGPPGGITWLLEGEQVVEGPRRTVTTGERRLPQVPDLPQGGDQRGVPVLLSRQRLLGYPGRHHDARDPVAGAVEGEPELAFVSSGGSTAGGGTWSKVPPGSSQPMKSVVFQTFDAPSVGAFLTASYRRARNASPSMMAEPQSTGRANRRSSHHRTAGGSRHGRPAGWVR